MPVEVNPTHEEFNQDTPTQALPGFLPSAALVKNWDLILQNRKEGEQLKVHVMSLRMIWCKSCLFVRRSNSSHVK